MQDIVIDVFQPVFRKDEETAWTLVQSKQSTRRTPSTRYADSVRDALQNHEVVEHVGRKFTFENDLFLSPVYKRLLLRSLSAPDLVEDNLLHESSSVSTTKPGRAPEIHINDASTCERSSLSDELDLSPGNIINTLRSAGNFSIGVHVDLREMRHTAHRFNLPKRSLPLHSVLKQAQMDSDEQSRLNIYLLEAALLEKPDLVAKALDNGADINAVGKDGKSALDICLDRLNSKSRHRYSIVLELLLLYKETTMHSKGQDKRTILHLAILSGNVAMVACLIKNRSSEVRSLIRHGPPRLYVAPAFSHQDMTPFRAINRLLAAESINPDTILEYEGKSALHLAAVDGDADFGAMLVRVGCNPFAPIHETVNSKSLKELYGSALFFAMKLGHAEFVRCVLDACSKCPIDLKRTKVGRDDALELVRIAEDDGLYEIAEVLMRKWVAWAQEATMREFLKDSFQTSEPTRELGVLLLTLIAQGCFQSELSPPWDISPLVPHLWAICDAEWAIHVFEGLKGVDGPSFVYRLTSPAFPQSVELERHDLEDLLVQILYARGRDWARSGRHGEVRNPERFAGPPTEVERASYVRELLETNTPYTWRGVQVTNPTAHELHYVLDSYRGAWLKRLYFLPDAQGQPTLVQNARELLYTYMSWRSLEAEERAEDASEEGVTEHLVPEESEKEYEGLWG